MMNFIKLNQRDITSQREALIKWRIELHHSLANKTSSADQNFYIIEKKWLENYEKNVLNLKNYELKFNKDDYKLTNQLSEQILSSSTIYSLPEIFVLNDNTWKSIYKFFGEKSSSDNNFNSNCKKAKFQNNILLFKINNLEKYCFFYLDENAQINQGYLQINDKNKREEIIKAIRKNGPSELNKYNRSNDGITIIIFQTNKKNINPKIVTSPESINNNNKGNASNNMNNIHIQNNFHKDNNISNAKNYKNMNNNRNNNNKINNEKKENNIKKNINNQININNNNYRIQNDNHGKNYQQNFISNHEGYKEKMQKEKLAKNQNNLFNINNIKIKKNDNIKLNPQLNKINIKFDNNNNEEKNFNKKQIKIVKKENPKNNLTSEELIKDKNNLEIISKKKLKLNIIGKRMGSVDLRRSKYINKNKEPDIEPSEPEKKNIIEELSKPGLIGLENIGATCYMNATLQCFSNVERLRKFLLMQYVYQELEKGKETTYVLSFALAEVLKNLWENLTKKYYAPIHFKEVISNMNPLFKGIAANDSKDLILFLLENIHNELNVRKQVVQDLNIPEPNQADYNAVYYEFVSNYFNKNNSIISQEFYGTNNAMTTCENCNISLHNVQIFNIFIFPLEEVRKFKNYNMNIVTLMDCFDFYQKIVTYQNYYCNYCQGNFSAFSQTRIVDAPKTIIINLNRGRGKEFNVDIVFEEYLNLKNYAYNKNNSNFYELIGVISHYGTSDMAGHFIAFCKNSNNNKWYKFNDGFVDESSFSEAKDNGMPYVLFYTVVSD